ncbi:unnamed protein product [Rotaria sordida]|uniref:Serine/threonine-protein kinase PLK4 n=1 Tax=Rotaria sordida TaxID=392033 RepID=A0A819C5I4_9BILA|nr:unnamed protein product [Rotaria sordida]
MICDNVPIFSPDEKRSHYELSRELGKGGFAIVYEARRKADGLRVACKKIDRKKLEPENIHNHPSYGNHRHLLPSSRSTSMSERLKAEVTIHHQVKHRNIVELLNYFEDDKYVYLILELCSHGDLEHYLKEKKTLCESETQTIVKQVVDGLVYLHNHGIIHRDIKLSNLLLNETFEVKIADFGLAKKIPLTCEQTNETICGTPNYISPEIASRAPHSFATDVWSLGILIATLLTGQPPFDTDTVHGTLSKVTHEKYELPTTFSEEVQHLVNSTLKKLAASRPNIIEICNHPFFSKDFSRSSQSNNYKFALWGPAVDRSHDSGFAENIGQQRSTTSTESNCTSISKGIYSTHLYSPNPISSPPTLQHNEPIYKSTPARNKTYEYYVKHSAQQQPTYIGQSPSLDISSRYIDNSYNGTITLNDPRPTSATSSVRSQDSGVAQSEPKTSIDCSAKSESSPKVSIDNSNNHYVSNNNPLTMGHHRLSSSESNQHALITQSEQGVNINAEQIREKLSPLNTQRLKPHRQATKTLIMNIMDNGEVVLESIRTKSTKRRIVDVFRVSPDGLHIITYIPNSRHGSPAKDHPPPIPRDKNAYQQYHFDRLPSEYWKKYQYAYKFVTLVRSRSPKIILYTPYAKCSLMETGVDFEAVFLCGVKITIFREHCKSDDSLKIKIINNNDKSESLLEYDRITTPNISAIEHFSPEIRQMIDNAILCYKFCLSKDKILEESQRNFSSIQVFPVQFGKKNIQPDLNRPNTPSSVTRTPLSRLGGSSSTINEPNVVPSSSIDTPSPILSTRLEFASENDIRKVKNPSNIFSISSSASRMSDYHHYQVTYKPKSSIQAANQSRSQSVHPSSFYTPDTLSSSSFSNRPSSTNINNNMCASTASLNSITNDGTTMITTQQVIGTNKMPLTRKSITEYSNRTFRVVFSDDSVMIIRDDAPDGQIFIDAQGKSYSFDRRQPHQPEAIQERLALFYQNEHDLGDYTTSQ